MRLRGRNDSTVERPLSVWREAGWIAALGATVLGASLLASHNAHRASVKPAPSSPSPQPLTPAMEFLLRAKAPSAQNKLLQVLPLVQCDLTYDKSTKTWVPYNGKHDHYVSPKQPELYGLGVGQTEEFEGAAGTVDEHGFPGMDLGIDTIDATASNSFVKLHLKPDEMTGYRLPKPTDIKIPLVYGKPVMRRYDTVIYDVMKNEQGQIGIAFACNPMIMNRENRPG